MISQKGKIALIELQGGILGRTSEFDLEWKKHFIFPITQGKDCPI